MPPWAKIIARFEAHGYPGSGRTGYPVSGFWIIRISGKISIWCIPNQEIRITDTTDLDRRYSERHNLKSSKANSRLKKVVAGPPFYRCGSGSSFPPLSPYLHLKLSISRSGCCCGGSSSLGMARGNPKISTRWIVSLLSN